MKQLLLLIVVVILASSGCTNEPDVPRPNQRPKTFFWIYPDSSILEGNSKQRIHWWGDDPDGIVKGFLFASGKFMMPGKSLDQLDSLNVIRWSWTTAYDTFVAFPLIVKRDTFDIAIRAVDNTFQQVLPPNAIVRFKPEPFWDVNDNGQFDNGDVALPSLSSAIDLKGTTQAVPLLNIPPKINFAPDPNDPNVTMQQPPITFTVATFSWVGTDDDGDHTIAQYEISLNDTASGRRFVVSSNVNLITMVVPRTLSDTATREVSADVYSGTFRTRRQFLGVIQGLRLDTINTCYVRARDVAGDVSPDSLRRWFVKKPRGKILIVKDYITANDSAFAFNLYRSTLDTLKTLYSLDYDSSAFIDVGAGLTSDQKLTNRIGIYVPPFIDPAFIYTLRLFDAVIWYTDPYPSLSVARFPLYQYVNDPSHRGKVLYTTMFQYSSDPSGALKDFAPLDSISSVNLDASRLLPTFGDTRIPGGNNAYYLYADSSTPGNIFPNLRFTTTDALHSVYLRQIYKRPDSKYIYRIQEDTRSPIKYTYLATMNDLRSVSAIGANAWACGANGTIVATSNDGTTWQRQASNTSETLNDVKFIDENKGWIVGENGVVLRTTNGGAVWQISAQSFEDLRGLFFISSTTGVAVATSTRGRIEDKTSILRTTDGGSVWRSISSGTTLNLNKVAFADDNFGIAIGDSGVMVRTTNGGLQWDTLQRRTVRKLNAITFVNTSTVIIVGTGGFVLRSTDRGVNWNGRSITSLELISVSFSNENNGWASGVNGTFFITSDGGETWTNKSLTTTPGVTQSIQGIALTDINKGWCVCTGGVILRTENGGTSWNFQPKGNFNVGVINGERSFVFLGLPLHRLNGSGNLTREFLEYVLLREFGL
jgi:photosystem II stability/assembly factor-like uncharacterized protein